MGTWSRSEVEAAFADYNAAVQVAVDTGDWSHLSNVFTHDAVYIDYGDGRMRGRAEITMWLTHTMNMFPLSEMVAFPILWSVIEDGTGRVISKVRNVMRDPGDGSVHEIHNIAVMEYAGDGMWSYEEDAYSPIDTYEMTRAWGLIAERHGTLTPEARDYYDRIGGL